MVGWEREVNASVRCSLAQAGNLASCRRYVTRNFTFISSVLLCSNRLDVAGPCIDSGVDRRLCCRSLAACFLEGKPIAEFILALQVRLVLVTVQPL